MRAEKIVMEIEEDKLTDRKMNIFRQFHISICLSWHTIMEYNKSPPCLNLAEEHSRLIKNIPELGLITKQYLKALKMIYKHNERLTG